MFLVCAVRTAPNTLLSTDVYTTVMASVVFFLVFFLDFLSGSEPDWEPLSGLPDQRQESKNQIRL